MSGASRLRAKRTQLMADAYPTWPSQQAFLTIRSTTTLVESTGPRQAITQTVSNTWNLLMTLITTTKQLPDESQGKVADDEVQRVQDRRVKIRLAEKLRVVPEPLPPRRSQQVPPQQADDERRGHWPEREEDER